MKNKSSLFMTLVICFTGVMGIQSQSNCQPHLTLAGQVSNKITPANLGLCQALQVKCSESDQSPWKILSFRVVRVPKNGDPTVSQSTGGSFSKETLTQLKKTKEDDILYFEEIKLVNANGEEKELTMIVEVY